LTAAWSSSSRIDTSAMIEFLDKLDAVEKGLVTGYGGALVINCAL
jgi:hypothetical protein